MEIDYSHVDTPRLRCEPFSEDDVEPHCIALMQDPDVCRYVGDRRVPTLQETWRAVAGWIGHWALRGYGNGPSRSARAASWSAGPGSSTRPTGRGRRSATCWASDWWGRGYATEAARAAMDWGFATIGFDRLISLIDPANAASIAVAERLGETLDGETELWGNRVLMYGIDRATWSARQPEPA